MSSTVCVGVCVCVFSDCTPDLAGIKFSQECVDVSHIFKM